MNKEYDVVGLGACGLDYFAQVSRFADKDNKVTSENLSYSEGGVTANNIIQAARLGLKTAWCGMLGVGKPSDLLIKKFGENNVKVFSHREGKTQFAWIVVDEQGERQIYVFPNSTNLITPKIVENKFKEVIEKSKHLHTEVAVLPLAAAIKGAEIAKKAGTKVLVDIDGEIDYLLNVAEVGTKEELNQLIELTDVLKLSESASKQISPELLEKVGLVIITLGKKGCFLYSGGEKVECPAYKIKCVDSTGAGDSFMGGLSYALLKDMGLKEVGMFANACGAYTCQYLGARSSGSLSEIRKLSEDNKQETL